MSIQEISIKTKQQWQNALNTVISYDIYQTYDYHKLFTSQTECMLLSFLKNEYKIYFPVLIRDIDNTLYKDITSVYGYGGLISNHSDLPTKIKTFFKEELTSYFQEKNIISAFSRLHPLLKSSYNFPENMGIIEDINQTVYINLNLSEKEQISQYSASLRRQLRNAYDAGVQIKIANKSEGMKFVSLYYKTMDRLHANKNYYFSEEYFNGLIHATDFQTIILFAEYKGTVIGGGLFTCCNNIMQYHLGAVPEEFLCYSPLKVIIDTARQIGKQKRLAYLHLGGGYAGKDNDGLFAFKSRFSKERAIFKVWKYITDETIYTDLVLQKFNGIVPESNFFPLYRAI